MRDLKTQGKLFGSAHPKFDDIRNTGYQDQREKFCGATLITAAHCVLPNGELATTESLTFIVRELNPYYLDDTETSVIPDLVFPHPSYSYRDNLARNDLALLFVREPIPILQLSGGNGNSSTLSQYILWNSVGSTYR